MSSAMVNSSSLPAAASLLGAPLGKNLHITALSVSLYANYTLQQRNSLIVVGRDMQGGFTHANGH